MAPIERLHALDALRAAMMLLGILLHGVVSYGPTDFGNDWPIQDPNTHVLWDLAAGFIHVFQMPVFFVMAGFFTAMLVERRGPGGMFRNRLMRIGLPFVLFWPPLFVLSRTGTDFALFHAETDWRGALDEVWRELQTGGLFAHPSTIHLWFLYYLLHFYALAAAVYGASRLLSPAMRNRAITLLDGLLLGRPRLLVLTAITGASMITMTSGGLDTDATFRVGNDTLTAYAVFFGVGWLLYTRRERLASLERFASQNLGLGVASVLVVGWMRGMQFRAEDPTTHAVSTFVLALATWQLIFGLTGAFLRHANRPNTRTRYLVDASYWAYLVHLPFCCWLPGMLRDVDVPALLKAPLVIAIFTPFVFGSYHLFVRSTWIGVLLNGRRYPAPLPWKRPAGTGGV